MLDDRCPRCRLVDYLPLDGLKARCRRCKTVYQRREAAGGDQVPAAASKRVAGWSARRVLHCPTCGHPAYIQLEGSVRRCWSCDHVWDPERTATAGREAGRHA